MIKQLLNPLSSHFYLYEGNSLPPQLTTIALFQHINTCSFSRSLQISLKFSVNIADPPISWIMSKKYIATGRLDKVFFDYVTPNPTWISSLLLNSSWISSWISWIYRDIHGTFCFFCKMVINKTILMAISLSYRSCPYEFNASIDCWLKTTSHYDVIAPSTVSTTQDAKLLPSPNLCHSLTLCHVTRSQHMGQCETLRRSTSISRAI